MGDNEETNTGTAGDSSSASNASTASQGPVPPLNLDPQELLRLLASAFAMQMPQRPSASLSQPPPVKSLVMPKLNSPESLSFPQFSDWKQRWQDYATANQLDQQSLQLQQGVLRSALDTEWTMLWSSGRIPILTTHSMEEVIAFLEAYLRSKRNPLLDRQAFHKRDQMAGESVDRYYAALKSLDDACAHEAVFTCNGCRAACQLTCPSCNTLGSIAQCLAEIRIRDRLICGLRDKEMQRRVLSEQYSESLSLEKVLSICTAVENSKRTGASLGLGKSEIAVVDANQRKSSYKKMKSGGNSNVPPDSTQQPKTSAKSCVNCGNSGHNRGPSCPAKGKTCSYCGKEGHFSKTCLKQKRDQAKEQQQQQAKSSDTASQIRQNSSISGTGLQLLSIHSGIGKHIGLVKWLADTGAEVDAISLNDLKKILGADAAKSLSPDVDDVGAANGSRLKPIGSIPMTLLLNGRSYHSKLGVYKKVNVPLLSKKGCIALGLIPADWPLSAASNTIHTISSGEEREISPKPPATEHAAKKSVLIQEFPETFNDAVLRPMEGPPMSIELVTGAIPVKRYKAHTIPFHWRDTVKQQLDTMVTKGIIEPVPIGEPVDWCHPMVVVAKKGSAEPRITVDLTGLNKFVRRPAYPVRVPREVIARIPPGNKFFTTLDARHGYWQVPLDDASRKLTSFITPWGSFRYRRNVMGLISAGDEHNRRGDEALLGIENVEKIVEDILIFDKDLDSHVKRVKEVLLRCQKHGITLNAKKFVFAQPEVDWCGFHISEHGYTPAPHLVDALRKFPTPTSKTDVRSFCGLAQQFEPFSHRITELAAPIRALLSSNSVFVWEEAQQRAFNALIDELTSSRVLAQFHPSWPLRLETDAAQSKGLGYALWQQQPDDTWKLLQVGSRFVTPTESRYSASEVELLAVVWAVKKCRLYLLGQPFELVVDHRPLIPIINSKTLDEIENPRLLRLKEKLASFRPTAVWRAGSQHKIVDTFSRFPVADPDDEDLQDSPDADPPSLLVAALHDAEDGSQVITDPLLEGIREAAELCSEYQRLRQLIMHGFTSKDKLDDDLKPYWKVREDLSLEDNLIFMGSRLLVPKSLRHSVLETLHLSHQGQSRTLRRAQQSVFWPGVSNDVRNIVRSCQECATHLPSLQKEPLQNDAPAIYPFQEVGCDLFSHAGYEYLVMIDRFSGWINVAKCGTSANSSNVIFHLKTWMTDFGIPVKLTSDNGTQFSSMEFQNWCKKWGIQHVTSSPHYPQSNGLAEAAVKQAKLLISKSTDNGDISKEKFQLGLLELRNTPRADGRSPAQLVFGCPICSTLPLHRSKFAQEWKGRSEACDIRASLLREKAREYYDRTSQPLKPLRQGTIVLIQDFKTRQWTIPAEVVDIKGRSHILKTESGRLLRRNRRFLRPFNAAPKEPLQEVVPTPAPRCSTRTRRPPQRFTHLIQCSRRSHFKGGHEGYCVASSPRCIEAAEYKLSLTSSSIASSHHFDREHDPTHSVPL